MRLKTNDKIHVAAAVTHEKIERRRVALLRKIKKEATAMYTAVYGKWTETVEGWDHNFIARFKHARLRAPGAGFRLSGATSTGDCYRQGVRSKSTAHNYPMPSIKSEIFVDFDTDFANAKDNYRVRMGLDTKRLNPLFEEWKELSREADEIFSEVWKFISQFNTYKQALKEWPDLDRYLRNTDVPIQKKKGNATALIKTGADLKSFLSKH